MSSPLDDPEFLHERAVKGAKARHDAVNRARSIVRDWPALTDDQKTRIRAVLRPVVSTDSNSGAA
jgi:hypothetical protein